MSLSETLQQWMDIPLLIEERRFLEAHPELLAQESVELLDSSIAEIRKTIQDGRQTAEGAAEEQAIQHLLYHSGILRDVRRRCASLGTIEAIRETYINRFGAFILELPPAVEALKTSIADSRTPAQKKALLLLLPEATGRLQHESSVAPEILAELQIWIGSLSLREYFRTQDEGLLQKAIAAFEKSLPTYTLARYPSRYALAQHNRGSAYAQLAQLTDDAYQNNLMQAIASFEAALAVSTREDAPVEWAQAQYNLGIAYRELRTGNTSDHLERAIACSTAAISIYTEESFPEEWARIVDSLGTAYRERGAGEKADNLVH